MTAFEHRHGFAAGTVTAALHQAVGGGWQAGRTPATIEAAFAAALGVGTAEAESAPRATHADTMVEPALAAFLSSIRTEAMVAVVSNNGPDVRRRWDEAHALDDLVDLIVISGEERIAKPAPGIYLRAAERLGLASNRCIFVDDAARNVAGAQRVGLLAIHHTTPSRTIAGLRNSLHVLDTGPGGST